MFGIIIIIVLLIPLSAIVLDSQLGRALASRIERGKVPSDDLMGRRVAALEAEVERMTKELQRLEEESDFLRRLLEDRPSTGGALPSGEKRS